MTRKTTRSGGATGISTVLQLNAKYFQLSTTQKFLKSSKMHILCVSESNETLKL